MGEGRPYAIGGRWESALLVNVDNTPLRRLWGNKKAMEAPDEHRGFRN